MQPNDALSHPTAIALLSDIAQLMRRQASQDDDLWTADDVAAYLKLSKSTVQQRIIGKVGFPRPVILPTAHDSSGGGKRYLAKEVKAWTLRHR